MTGLGFNEQGLALKTLDGATDVDGCSLRRLGERWNTG